MIRAVLISNKPKWCEKIANREKKIEVRKTKPKLETPFKCLIYCTKGKDLLREVDNWHTGTKTHTTNYRIINLDYCTNKIANGKVIGEFVCDRIDEYANGEIALSHNTDETCLTNCELADYIEGSKAYFWHITDLKIYDKPKELSEFRKPCPYTDGTYCIEIKCEYYGSWTGVCRCWVERPPQSWCYVED